MTDKRSQEELRRKNNGREAQASQQNLKTVSKREKARAPNKRPIGKTSDERSDKR